MKGLGGGDGSGKILRLREVKLNMVGGGGPLRKASSIGSTRIYHQHYLHFITTSGVTKEKGENAR